MLLNEHLEIITQDDPESGFRVVRLKGPLVIKTVVDFEQAIRSENPYGLILDLANVGYMDSAGLGAVLGGYSLYQLKKKPFALANVNSRIQTLFELTHTDQFLMPYPSVESAKSVAGEPEAS